MHTHTHTHTSGLASRTWEMLARASDTRAAKDNNSRNGFANWNQQDKFKMSSLESSNWKCKEETKRT